MNAMVPNRVRLSKVSQSDMKKVVRAETLKQIALTPFEINLVLAATLRKQLGWGKKRIERFILNTGEIQDYFNGRYDDADLYAMEVKLKEIGVDIKELIKNVE
ncbi:MAG: hypothetical protein MJ236_04770 [Clostridia bacterium]|nr:hypothetical protein [Clostridia bacterium]